MSERPAYSMGEEIANAVTHGVGAVLALVSFGYMLALCVHFGTPLAVVSVTVYCLTLFFMFLCSTSYHALPYRKAKHILQILDHCAIFLLIAGTYTPYTLLILQGGWRVLFTAVIWGAALVGVLLNAVDMKRFSRLCFVLYLVMGWAVVLALPKLVAVLPVEALLWLLAGGIAYCIGVLFYVRKGKPFMHFIWHLFVLAGAVLHFYGILLYVLPAACGAA